MSTAPTAASTASGSASTEKTPRRSTRFSTVYAPLIAFIFPMAVYLMTMARGLIWGDGIELSAVAYTLGIAHPTGYPLFTMVGHLFTRIPIGSAYWRTTLMCAFSVAGASVILFYMIRSLGDTLWEKSFPSPSSRAVLALAGSLTFAWAFAPWENATLTEVYSVELLFQVGVAALALRVLRTRSVKGFWAMAFLFGLGMTHHMLTLTVAPFLATVAFVLLARRKSPTLEESTTNNSNSAGAPSGASAKQNAVRSRKNNASESEANATAAAASKISKAPEYPSRARVLLLAAAFFLVGLLPILYLPIRASQSPPLNWGDPSSLKQLMWTLEGGEFRQYRFMMEKPGTPFTYETYWTFFFHRAADLSRYITGQVIAPDGNDNPLWGFMFLAAVALFIFGIRRLAGRFRAFTVGLVLSLGLYLFFLFTYNIADIRDYELGFLALLWPILWIGFAEIPRWGAWEWRRVGETARASRVVLLAFAIPLAALLFNYRSADRSTSDIANQYAVRLLTLPPNAILLTAGDNDIYSCWYLQEVEGFRKDVLVYGSNFIFSPWYKHYFTARELNGRRIGISDEHPTTDVAFIQALSKHVIDPNLGRKFLIYTTLNIRPLHAAYVLRRVEYLLTEKELEAALAEGEFPPGAALYKIVRPVSQKDNTAPSK